MTAFVIVACLVALSLGFFAGLVIGAMMCVHGLRIRAREMRRREREES